MLGAIIGDIIGHPFEWISTKSKEFNLWHSKCTYTDDSVCTAAVADILLNDLNDSPDDPQATNTLQAWCRRHPGRGYGGMFRLWIRSDSPKPYNSYGNGAAMRVSPAAFLNADDLEAALAASDRVTEITHNHPEGMKGARATVHATWLAYQKEAPESIRKVITDTYGYNLRESVDEIREWYTFDVTCQGSVPQAITCALEADSYEDAVRNAISLGGDADTQAAIAGGIAEALFGLPEEIRTYAEANCLGCGSGQEIRDIMTEMYASRS